MYRWCGEVVIPPWYWRRRVRERGWYSGGGLGRDGSQRVKPPFIFIKGGLGLLDGLGNKTGPKVYKGLG